MRESNVDEIDVVDHRFTNRSNNRVQEERLEGGEKVSLSVIFSTFASLYRERENSGSSRSINSTNSNSARRSLEATRQEGKKKKKKVDLI